MFLLLLQESPRVLSHRPDFFPFFFSKNDRATLPSSKPEHVPSFRRPSYRAIDDFFPPPFYCLRFFPPSRSIKPNGVLIDHTPPPTRARRGEMAFSRPLLGCAAAPSPAFFFPELCGDYPLEEDFPYTGILFVFFVSGSLPSGEFFPIPLPLRSNFYQ